jgi:hypothetical protein
LLINKEQFTKLSAIERGDTRVEREFKVHAERF